ncbi:MAG: 50S ribosomal protein P1 [Candidatus Micrarchaeia archaeon]|jgi:large subunit ribosomal protein L12
MEYIYAALLLDSLGKEINEENMKNVVKAAGKEPDEAMIKAVVNSLKGVNIKEVIKNAQTQQVAQQAAAPQQAQAQEKKEEKAEEKKSEEEAAGGLASLFG